MHAGGSGDKRLRLHNLTALIMHTTEAPPNSIARPNSASERESTGNYWVTKGTPEPEQPWQIWTISAAVILDTDYGIIINAPPSAIQTLFTVPSTMIFTEESLRPENSHQTGRWWLPSFAQGGTPSSGTNPVHAPVEPQQGVRPGHTKLAQSIHTTRTLHFPATVRSCAIGMPEPVMVQTPLRPAVWLWALT